MIGLKPVRITNLSENCELAVSVFSCDRSRFFGPVAQWQSGIYSSMQVESSNLSGASGFIFTNENKVASI